ncbi:MAG: type II toxin-antitoxin system HicB family antitoxin [bacterium]
MLISDICPSLKDGRAWESIEKAINNLKEATELYLEEFLQYGVRSPFL